MPETPPFREQHEPEQEPVDRPIGVAVSDSFRDPVVRWMARIALVLVIAFLALVVGVLATGVISPSAPRTLAEKEVAVTAAAVTRGSTDPEEWGDYIAALISTGQYTRARGVIRDGRAIIDDSATAEFGLAEARLLSARGDHAEAIEVADAAMQQIRDVHDAVLAEGGQAARQARLSGLDPNYWALVLIKAYAFRQLAEWGSAIEQFDAYLDNSPTAADILIDRGLARFESGDKAGAEEDLRAALRFVPDNEEALDGLERIGAKP